MTLTLRYMRTADISDVMTIEQVSFSPPWTARSYSYEVNESNYSHMVVLTRPQAGAARAGLNGWLRRMTGQEPAQEQVLAYGGLWFIGGEGHISTLASRPDQRGRGYGELAFTAMVARSIALGADYIILEVRVSNLPAQALYKKYGFTIEGVKPHYYQSNDEDAYDMRLQLRTPGADIDGFLTRYQALLRSHTVADRYSTGETNPRQRPAKTP